MIHFSSPYEAQHKLGPLPFALAPVWLAHPARPLLCYEARFIGEPPSPPNDWAALTQALNALENAGQLRILLPVQAASLCTLRWREALRERIAKNSSLSARLILQFTDDERLTSVSCLLSSLHAQGLSLCLERLTWAASEQTDAFSLLFDFLRPAAVLTREIEPENTVSEQLYKLCQGAQTRDRVVIATAESPAKASYLCTLGVGALAGPLP